MQRRLRRTLLYALVAGASLALPLTAGAATKHKTHAKHAGIVRTSRSGTGSGETPLTGTTLSSATAAALAAVPGTVDRANTENDGTGAYEVIITKADGSHVKVVEDAGFSVIRTNTTNCH